MPDLWVPRSVEEAKAAAVIPASAPAAIEDWQAPFGPGIPLPSQRFDPREPAPRRSEYPISSNLQLSPNARGLVPFSTLRQVSDQTDLIRRCIEIRKSHLTALEWDVTLSKGAIEKAMDERGEMAPGEAFKKLRERHAHDINRLEQWWQTPDSVNGLDLISWLSMLMEEYLVIDAVSIYPRRSRRGDVICAELIDGSTIKPLLDHRGATPQPPLPAYQQILYGFPRGDFYADEGASEAFSLQQMMYRPRNRRTWTPYGYSAVENALSAADLYLKRTAWMRAEYTDGATPPTWLKISAGNVDTKKWTPDQLKAYEEIWNNELAGQTEARKRMRFLPPGTEIDAKEEWANRYHAEFDEHLVKLLCACFDVMPTEVGFPPSSGIGGKGHQEGEQDSTYRKEVRPTVTWMAGLISEFSRRYLGMPPELTFRFIGYEAEDRESNERIADSTTRGARMTINEARMAKGLPLFEFPEADTPFIIAGAGPQFLPGLLQQAQEQHDMAMQQAQAALAPPAATDAEGAAPGEPDLSGFTDDQLNTLADVAEQTPDDGGDDTTKAGWTGTQPRQFHGRFGNVSNPKRPAKAPGSPRKAPVTSAAKYRFMKALADSPWLQSLIDPSKRGADGRIVLTEKDFGSEKQAGAVIDRLMKQDGVTSPGINLIDVHGLLLEFPSYGVNIDPNTGHPVGKAARGSVSSGPLGPRGRKRVAVHVRNVAEAVDALWPSSRVLAESWVATLAASKRAGNQQARVFLLQHRKTDLGDVRNAVAGLYKESHSAGVARAAGKLGLGGNMQAGTTKLNRLLANTNSVADDAVSDREDHLAELFASTDNVDDLEQALDEGRSDDGWADDWAEDEINSGAVGGLLDSYEAAGYDRAKLSVSTGECDFCRGYDGRIMPIDSDAGMPPLHSNCQCTVDPS